MKWTNAAQYYMNCNNIVYPRNTYEFLIIPFLNVSLCSRLNWNNYWKYIVVF